jgi:hypothetical protein
MQKLHERCPVSGVPPCEPSRKAAGGVHAPWPPCESNRVRLSVPFRLQLYV